jgi:hypothetical protein
MSVNVGLQEIAVGLLVGGCALFSAWRLATVAVRLRMLDALAALPALGSAAWLARLRERTLARSTAGCGGCSQASSQVQGAPAQGDTAARTRAATPAGASPNRTPGELRR